MTLAETQRRRGTFFFYLCASASLRVNIRCAVLVILLLAQSAIAQDITTSVVLEGLQRPCGIAARPGGTADRYELFVADSGAGQVVRWSNLEPDAKHVVIDAYATGSSEELSKQNGPLTLLFVDPGLLIVGGTPERDQGLLRVYELPEGDHVLAVSQARERVASPAADARCWALTRSRPNAYVQDWLYILVRRTGDRGALFQSRLQAGTIGAMQPLLDVENDAKPLDFTAVTTSPTGRIVAVTHGADSDSDGGRLIFINPIEAQAELKVPLDLSAVVALAYSPTSSNLYAASFSGGIYRIDDTSRPGRPACRAMKIADVIRPTDLAFAPDGALYVTTFGDDHDSGTLQVITGDL